MPTMSKIPMMPMRVAAVVGAIEWSCAAGARCVTTMPSVDQPHTKNVSMSTQKAQCRAALRKAVRAIDAEAGPSSSTSCALAAPMAPTPTSAGRSRRNSAQSTAMTREHTPATNDAVRQPGPAAIMAMTGTKST